MDARGVTWAGTPDRQAPSALEPAYGVRGLDPFGITHGAVPSKVIPLADVEVGTERAESIESAGGADCRAV